MNTRAWFTKTSTAATSLASKKPVQMVRFTVDDIRIYPREAHAQKGLVLIAFRDLMGGSRGLVVERENGKGTLPINAGTINRDEHHLRGKDVLDFQPGRYQVYDARRPKDRATLIIEP